MKNDEECLSIENGKTRRMLPNNIKPLNSSCGPYFGTKPLEELGYKL